MTQQQENARRLIRAQNLCGHIEDDHVCVLPIGHDGTNHERVWSVEKCVEPDSNAQDSRELVDRMLAEQKPERPR